MRSTLAVFALLLAFSPAIPERQYFSPVPVAHGCRPSNACLSRCEKEHGRDCFQACDPCRRR